MPQGRYVFPFSQLRMTDVDRVGGKNASLGELLSQLTSAGIRVPDGFATTAEAFRLFLTENNLEERINDRLKDLNVEDVKALAQAGAEIRKMIEEAPFPAELEKEIREFYEWLKDGQEEISVAVRSSATAEDLPDASFAGQQETYLNVVGIDQVLSRMREVFASLYNDRAISYRVHKGFTHSEVALSAGVQRMCRSDKGAAGVMFTLDTESGFDQVVFITASYGLGETVVQGAVNPDEFYVHKPMLAAGNFIRIKNCLADKVHINRNGKHIAIVHARLFVLYLSVHTDNIFHAVHAGIAKQSVGKVQAQGEHGHTKQRPGKVRLTLLRFRYIKQQ